MLKLQGEAFIVLSIIQFHPSETIKAFGSLRPRVYALHLQEMAACKECIG